jgi:hypothetical protein
MQTITNEIDALTLALVLAVTAETDERANCALSVAELLQRRMTPADVESAVISAENRVGAYARVAADQAGTVATS